MIHRYITIAIIALFVMLGANSNLVAQPAGPPEDRDDCNKLGATGCLPIDDNIIWILVLGSLYGVYRAREKYKFKSISE